MKVIFVLRRRRTGGKKVVLVVYTFIKTNTIILLKVCRLFPSIMNETRTAMVCLEGKWDTKRNRKNQSN